MIHIRRCRFALGWFWEDKSNLVFMDWIARIWVRSVLRRLFSEEKLKVLSFRNGYGNFWKIVLTTLYSMRVAVCISSAVPVHGCVMKLLREFSLRTRCTCSEPLSVANAHKQICFFTKCVAGSCQMRQTRERSHWHIIYDLTTIGWRRNIVYLDEIRKRKRLSDFRRMIRICVSDDGDWWFPCALTMGLHRYREAVQFEFLSLQERENESACSKYESKTVTSMKLQAKIDQENGLSNLCT